MEKNGKIIKSYSIARNPWKKTVKNCKKLQKYTKIYKTIQKYTNIYKKLQKPYFFLFFARFFLFFARFCYVFLFTIASSSRSLGVHGRRATAQNAIG